jgi:hypothetical protein
MAIKHPPLIFTHNKPLRKHNVLNLVIDASIKRANLYYESQINQKKVVLRKAYFDPL